MDQLVIMLVARLYADAEAPPSACEYFTDGGGGFQISPSSPSRLALQ